MISNNVPTHRKDTFPPPVICLPNSQKMCSGITSILSPALLLSHKQKMKSPEYLIRHVIIQTITKYFVGEANHKQEKKDTTTPHP